MAGTSAGWEKRRPKTARAYIASKTVRVGNCLIWKSAKRGRVGFFQYKGVSGGAPRRVYEALVGKIPKDKCILHSCDDPRCVEPKHLRPGTRKENRQDFMERHPRAKQLCLNAARIGARGVKNFWDGMTPIQRRRFINRRAKIQAEKRNASINI